MSANREGSRCGSDRSNKWIRGEDKMDRKVVLVMVGERRDWGPVFHQSENQGVHFLFDDNSDLSKVK